METAEPACRLEIIFPLIPSYRLIHPTIMFDYRNFQPVPQLTYTKDEQEANQLVSQLRGCVLLRRLWMEIIELSLQAPWIRHGMAS